MGNLGMFATAAACDYTCFMASAYGTPFRLPVHPSMKQQHSAVRRKINHHHLFCVSHNHHWHCITTTTRLPPVTTAVGSQRPQRYVQHKRCS